MRLLLSIFLVFSVSAQAADTVADEVVAVSALESPVAAASVAEKVDEASAVVATPEKSKAESLKESEIPLNLDGGKKVAQEDSSVFRIMFTLSILGLVGAGAFFFLRKYKIPKAAKHQTQIKVLQQHYLGPKKSLAIVRVAGESILVGITDHNISMIKSLSLLDDEVPEEAPQSFGRVLGDIDETPTASERAPAKRAKELDADEEFAISGIKDIVSKRLKGMRSLQ
ncbi:MAG: flagellar biosynthetic protein FliO [Bdellovibrio sp.]|nr:flagellar biosynthetic protein FliO [Bdellovibrio sp.]